MNFLQQHRGFTLIELMIGLGVASILMTGITQVAIAAGASYQLQQNLGALHDNARFALDTIKKEVRGAGFQNQPWIPSTDLAIIAADPVSALSDKLVLRRRSDRNCLDNPNPATGSDGRPAMYLLESWFFINSGKNLAHTCRYGPNEAQLTTQINNLGLVEHAEALKAVYAEDTNSDGNADRWVPSGKWQDETNILAVKIGLLLSSPSPLDLKSYGDVHLLTEIVRPPNDGRLRKVFEVVYSIKGRL